MHAWILQASSKTRQDPNTKILANSAKDLTHHANKIRQTPKVF
ncbi:MAG: hypothetical protein ACTTIC_02100 [Helicobacteraceae bacterium]